MILTKARRKLVLSEMNQTVPFQFAFVTKQNKMCHQWVNCRDYLQDAVRVALTGKPCEIYGFKYELEKDRILDIAAGRPVPRFEEMCTSKKGRYSVKNSYEINPNQDFIALGMSNLFSGLSHGFVISGADSRTAVSDTAGGKTQLTSIIASLTVLSILLFFTFPLSYLPIASLSAIIISACIGLFNFGYMKKLYMVSKREFSAAVFTSLCVITIGVLPAVLIAIGLALLRLLIRASNPKDAILGKVENIDSYQDISE